MSKIYTSYSEHDDLTFILEDTYKDDTIVSTEIKGFYFGKPNMKSTEMFYGKTKAEYEGASND